MGVGAGQRISPHDLIGACRRQDPVSIGFSISGQTKNYGFTFEFSSCKYNESLHSFIPLSMSACNLHLEFYLWTTKFLA